MQTRNKSGLGGKGGKGIQSKERKFRTYEDLKKQQSVSGYAPSYTYDKKKRKIFDFESTLNDWEEQIDNFCANDRFTDYSETGEIDGFQCHHQEIDENVPQFCHGKRCTKPELHKRYKAKANPILENPLEDDEYWKVILEKNNIVEEEIPMAKAKSKKSTEKKRKSVSKKNKEPKKTSKVYKTKKKSPKSTSKKRNCSGNTKPRISRAPGISNTKILNMILRNTNHLVVESGDIKNGLVNLNQNLESKLQRLDMSLANFLEAPKPNNLNDEDVF